MNDPKSEIHYTLGFLKGVLQSILIIGKHQLDPKAALERILEDAERGLDQYDLYEKAKEVKLSGNS